MLTSTALYFFLFWSLRVISHVYIKMVKPGMLPRHLRDRRIVSMTYAKAPPNLVARSWLAGSAKHSDSYHVACISWLYSCTCCCFFDTVV